MEVPADSGGEETRHKDLTIKERLFLSHYVDCGNASEAHRRLRPDIKGRHNSSGYSMLRSIEEKVGGQERLWELLGLSLSDIAKTLKRNLNATAQVPVKVKVHRAVEAEPGKPKLVADEVVELVEVPDNAAQVNAARVAGMLVRKPDSQRVEASVGPVRVVVERF